MRFLTSLSRHPECCDAAAPVPSETAPCTPQKTHLSGAAPKGRQETKRFCRDTPAPRKKLELWGKGALLSRGGKTTGASTQRCKVPPHTSAQAHHVQRHMCAHKHENTCACTRCCAHPPTHAHTMDTDTQSCLHTHQPALAHLGTGRTPHTAVCPPVHVCRAHTCTHIPARAHTPVHTHAQPFPRFLVKKYPGR